MNVYSPIEISDITLSLYKPTRLYVKELNGLKYFGKSVCKDILKYHGSGTYWVNHCNKHGVENIKTIWVSDWFMCPYHLQDFALTFSEMNNIHLSDEWANLVPENGLSGGHYNILSKSKEEREKIYLKQGKSRANKTIDQKLDRHLKHSKSLLENWKNRTPEELTTHAVNTAIGVKNTWDNLSYSDRCIREANRQLTISAKSKEDIDKIGEKMSNTRSSLMYRPPVVKLRKYVKANNIRLGRNWGTRPIEWVIDKIKEYKIE